MTHEKKENTILGAVVAAVAVQTLKVPSNFAS